MSIDLFGKEITNQKKLLDRSILTEILSKMFASITLDELISLMTNELEELLEYTKLVEGQRACQKTSLLFNPHRLDTRTSSSKYSIFEAVHNEAFCSGLARAFNFKNGKVKELLYQVLQLGINGVQYVNEFPPHIAKQIYLEYNLGQSSRILDPCAGWGGRMLGASTVSNYYTAFEPSSKTHSGLMKLSKFIQQVDNNFIPELHCNPFEESNLEKSYYDFALTSPPYFDTELYSVEKTNSMNKFSNFDAWCEGFFFPLVHKTMSALNPKGIFVINIGSRKYPLNKKLLSLSNTYKITKLGNRLSGSGGLGKSDEGEMFYELRKIPELVRKGRR